MRNILLFYILFISSLIQIHANERIKTIQLEITVPSDINTDSVYATIPALKYNKKIVTSWTVDDSYSIYNQIFCVINKKWVDDELMSYWDANDNRMFFYHLNGEKTSGYIPQKALEYTDGCGISHRFAATVACWPWKLTDKDQDVGKFNVCISTKEINLMQDFGYTFCYHDVIQDIPLTSQDVFDKALSAAADSFQTKTGRTPKIMIEPNGNHDYVTFSLNNDLIEATIAQTIDRDVFPFKENESLEKTSGCIKRDFGDSSDKLYKKLYTELTLQEKERKWIINGSHRQYTNNVTAFLNKLDSTFGASGQDCVWVPSIDEYVEYSYMKNYTIINKSVEKNKITFMLQIPVKDRFWFKSLSLLLSGIQDTSEISVSVSDSVYGLSYGFSDKKLLVNLDFNDYLPEHAEKYTTIFENQRTVEAYEDALYFVSLLKKELQTPYLNRINSLVITPTVSEFKINNGNKQTSNKLVSVSFEASKSAVYYRLSESQYFEDASWKLLEPTPTFMLSPKIGTKKVYLQLKNALYLTNTISAEIELQEQKFKLVVGLSGSSTANSTELVNEEMLNNVALGFKDSYNALKLYDVYGNQSMKLAKNKSDISLALSKYGISEGLRKTSKNYDPSFSGDLGTYPDRYYSRANFIGTDSSIAKETCRLIAGFIDIPNGIYDIRVLASQSKQTLASDYEHYRYQVNNSNIYIPDSDIFYNNQNNFIEFKNITVDDGTLMICSWREPYEEKSGYYAPMNLIEIKEAILTGYNQIMLNASSMRICSAIGKLIIEKEDLLPFSIYTFEGAVAKYVIPVSQKTEIGLPAGVYIINNIKAIVY